MKNQIDFSSKTTPFVDKNGVPIANGATVRFLGDLRPFSDGRPRREYGRFFLTTNGEGIMFCYGGTFDKNGAPLLVSNGLSWENDGDPLYDLVIA